MYHADYNTINDVKKKINRIAGNRQCGFYNWRIEGLYQGSLGFKT